MSKEEKAKKKIRDRKERKKDKLKSLAAAEGTSLPSGNTGMEGKKVMILKKADLQLPPSSSSGPLESSNMQHGSEKVDKPSRRDKFRKEKREKPSGSDAAMTGGEKRGSLGGGLKSGPSAGGPPPNPPSIRLLAKRDVPPVPPS
jgi:hypothetical protein